MKLCNSEESLQLGASRFVNSYEREAAGDSGRSQQPRWRRQQAGSSVPAAPAAPSGTGAPGARGRTQPRGAEPGSRAPLPQGLREYFGQFGEVKECLVMRDPLTKRSRGFGFVTFMDQAGVDKVLAQSRHELDSKTSSYRVWEGAAGEAAAGEHKGLVAEAREDWPAIAIPCRICSVQQVGAAKAAAAVSPEPSLC
uniref:RRM domain-containing protein n=1 Tax=Apteryx owenii TaxID=8824 RepID=A0A8B9S964_APTOW